MPPSMVVEGLAIFIKEKGYSCGPISVSHVDVNNQAASNGISDVCVSGSLRKIGYQNCPGAAARGLTSFRLFVIHDCLGRVTMVMVGLCLSQVFILIFVVILVPVTVVVGRGLSSIAWVAV